MTREEKIQELVEKMKSDKVESNLEELIFTLVLNEEPVPYARERHTRFGGKNGKGRFYNKRASYMDRIHKEFEKQLSKELKNKISAIVAAKEEKHYYVTINGKFYIKIPKSDSMKKAAMKELNLIRPTVVRGDVDNYMKLILDVLHGISYDDDAHVIDIHSEKYYSLHPRVELEVRIQYEV